MDGGVKPVFYGYRASTTWLTRFRDLQGQLARWMEELSQYSMVIEHRLGLSMEMRMECLQFRIHCPIVISIVLEREWKICPVVGVFFVSEICRNC